MEALVVKRLRTTSYEHSLAGYVKTQNRISELGRATRNRGNTTWATLWVIPKTRAAAAGLGPSQVSLLPSFLFRSVSTKQKAPSIVHKTWLGLPHAACVDTGQKSGAGGMSELLVRCCGRVGQADKGSRGPGRDGRSRGVSTPRKSRGQEDTDQGNGHQDREREALEVRRKGTSGTGADL